MTKKLLKQKTSGSIYAWTKELAKRNDMVEYVPEPEAPAKPAESVDATPDDEIKAMARAVLTKKPGRKADDVVPSGDAAVS